MSDLVFSSPAKREKFLKSIAFHQAKIAAKKAAKQLECFAPLPDVNGAAKVVTTPTVPGQVAGLPRKVVSRSPREQTDLFPSELAYFRLFPVTHVRARRHG